MSDVRRVVSDTGPLITLEKLSDGYRFIRLLYDVIFVPPAVLEELVQGQFDHPDAYLTHYGVHDLIRVDEVEYREAIAGIETLDAGEQEAIRLALDRDLPLLIEEEAGRLAARRLGIRISGIAGQIVHALKSKRIDTAEATLKLRALYEAGRINVRIYEGLTAAVRGE